MGYSTCGRHGKRTCDGCDACPDCDGFRMHVDRCPVNWCPKSTICPTCRPKFDRAKAHEHCAEWSAQYARERAEAERVLDAAPLELPLSEAERAALAQLNGPAAPVADVPFSLSPVIGRRSSKQGGLFDAED